MVARCGGNQRGASLSFQAGGTCNAEMERRTKAAYAAIIGKFPKGCFEIRAVENSNGAELTVYCGFRHMEAVQL